MNGKFLQLVHQIPQEFRSLMQWAISTPHKSPIYANSSGLHNALVNNADTWMAFENACSVASWLNDPGNAMSIKDQLVRLDWDGTQGEFGIGFMFSEYDPYAVVDLDYKDEHNAPTKPHLWTKQEDIERWSRIIDYFSSYTERSPSGKGYHILVKAKVGEGRRRDSTEVYDRGRFMRCTGDVVLAQDVVDAQEGIDLLITEMNNSRKQTYADLDESSPEVQDDVDVLEMGLAAENGGKFDLLCRGEWGQLGYSSASEADLSLMSMLAFYSQNNEQCRRLFRATALGKREKHVRRGNYYMDRILRIIRGRQGQEVDMQEFIRKVAMENVEAIKAGTAGETVEQAKEDYNIPSPVIPEQPLQHMGKLANEMLAEPPENINWPPGLAGEIAKFIYMASPRPIPEVSIVATLGLLAGICGKAFTIPKSGLNMYITLVGRSAVGKEAMHLGPSLLMAAVRESVPAAMNFVTFDEYVSGQALMKVVAENQSFVQISGEWGRRMKRLAEDKQEGPMASLRTAMLNLYQKSAPDSMVGGMSYSNSDNNIASTNGVAYSMIGETTPNTFYESLTESMMEDGFMSRFLIVEYHGNRPDHNKNSLSKPWPELTEAVSQLCTQALTLIGRQQHQPVGAEPDAAEVLNAFDLHCDGKINSFEDESRRQMWNRAHLKACRVAALLAVADNWLQPVVTMVHVQWAINLIKRDIVTMSRKMEAGDIGRGDVVQQTKVISVLKEYLKNMSVTTDVLKQNCIIQRSYIQTRVSRHSAFYKHSLGVSHALNSAIMALIDNGVLAEVPRQEMVNTFKLSGKAYRILELPRY